MRNRCSIAAIIGILFATSSIAETLAENPYYQQMQQKLNQASAQAAKNFEQKYPQPRVKNNLSENKIEETIPHNKPLPPVSEQRAQPIMRQNQTPTPTENVPSVAIKEKTEKQPNNTQSFNIYLPPSSNTSNSH